MADAWEKSIQAPISFLITETPSDTFEERATELQEMLISLAVLRKFFESQPPPLIFDNSNNN